MPTSASVSHCPDDCRDDTPHVHMIVKLQCRCGGYTALWAIKGSLAADATKGLAVVDGITEAGLSSLTIDSCRTCSYILSQRKPA